MDRLAVVGRRHVRHVRDLVDAPHRPATHAVVFCYRVAYRGVPTGRVHIGTRLFLHADVEDLTHGRGDLPTVLRTLHARGVEFQQAGRFDPLIHMTNRADPELRSRAADYLGVATSTVHPAGGADGLAWTGMARLVDGTRLHGRIPGAGDQLSTTMLVESTHTLANPHARGLLDARSWRWAAPDGAGRGGDLIEEITALDMLHDLVRAAESPPPLIPRQPRHASR